MIVFLSFIPLKECLPLRTPLTLPALKQHLTYNWWKYLLLALLSFGLIDLLYSMTQYRPPKEKKIEFYVYGIINEEPLTEYLDQIRADEMSDMEVLSPQMMTPDESYGPMQLMTYLTAGEGDVYLLPRDQFVSYASSGAKTASACRAAGAKTPKPGKPIFTASRRSSSPAFTSTPWRRTDSSA